MRSRITLLGVLALSLLAPASALAAGGPALEGYATNLPSHFAPEGSGEIFLIVNNVGSEPTTAPVTITDTLPSGVSPIKATVEVKNGDGGKPGGNCSIELQAVTCSLGQAVRPGRHIEEFITVDVGPLADGSILPDQATVSGGGSPSVSVDTTETVDSGSPGFDFLPGPTGFSAPMTADDGAPDNLAGSHPHQLGVQLAFPTRKPGEALSGAGYLRDAFTELPPGLVFDPSATPVRCTQAQLATQFPSCPRASQVGTITITTVAVLPEAATSAVYNMVTPPGAPALLGFDALGVGVFAYIEGGVRSDGDFGITGGSTTIDALPLNPIFGIHLELWGDPSSPSHNAVGGLCALFQGASCPTEPRDASFITLPTACSGQPNATVAHADSWEEPGLFHQREYLSSDLAGIPVSVAGCGQLEFEPTLAVQPTTNLADSPTGLEVDLHQPQNSHKEQRSTAQLRNATVTLPPGLVANPAQADGLAACSQEQVGYLGKGHYSKAPQSCPDAAKLGTVEVKTPLLAQYTDQGTKLVTDPETGRPIPRPLSGSIYLAKPFENQFDSLLALYLVVEDPQSGTIAKLAGKVTPDPATGQLTTTFEENPQLPLEDVHLRLFRGPRASLTTPLVCGSHTTTSDLTPWSAPEGGDAHPESSFQTTAEPGGGNCPTSEGAAANAPSFSAGTVAPRAGAYSPFALKLSREDGSQRITGIDTVLPPGLTGKLAGIAACPEGQIAQAASRDNPEEGRLERESPSCPIASEVGVVNVAAGSGPTPFYTQGHAYLAGPYKGAPLSLAIITPAVAGPFDLGTVVTRVALYVEPETAQIHAVSDPLPQILDGIPLDVRSVALTMDRPNFILNPTSCDPLAITGGVTSALGQSAALNQRFQVGGCSSLAFKPKLSLRLMGSVKRSSNPRLIATLRAQAGEANIAAARVKLPHPVFLDQAHIRTICTRVQFAADSCPAGSVYGRAEAVTLLLDHPLSGSVYLRSSSHPLPDLVAKLKGPDSQPIEIDLVGKTDAVKAALRNTFEAVPDAPVSSFRLELFGGKRGLVEMSQGFCSHRRAAVQLTGQNGKTYDTRPMVAATCPKRRQGKGGGKRGGHRAVHHRPSGR